MFVWRGGLRPLDNSHMQTSICAAGPGLIYPLPPQEPHSPPDLAPFYDSARLVIAPHQYASGVMFKLSEAMAAGVPAVLANGGNDNNVTTTANNDTAAHAVARYRIDLTQV